MLAKQLLEQFIYSVTPEERIKPVYKYSRRAKWPAIFIRSMEQYTEDQKKIGEWVRTISDQSYRGWHAFYHTKEWKKMRAEILERDHGQCQRCRAMGRYRKAVTVHHVKHLKDAPELALTEDNLMSLCQKCHEDMHPEFRYKPKGFQNHERW